MEIIHHKTKTLWVKKLVKSFLNTKVCYADKYKKNNSSIMKYSLSIILFTIFTVGCSTTIPVQSSLSDQVMLMADNKNYHAEYSLSSDVPNGKITTINISRSGTERSSDMLDYASETAFNNIWTSYFDNKFNAFSRDTMRINVTLKELM